MRFPIRYQILLPYTAVVLFTLVAATLLNAYVASRRIEEQTGRQLQQIAETISTATFPFTDAVLAQMKGLSGAEFVLLDEAGRVQASSRRWLSAISAARPGAARGAKSRLGTRVAIDGAAYFQTTMPVEPRNGARGPLLLHVLLPETQWHALRWQAAYPSLLIGGVALLLVVACAVAIAGRIGRPIQRLRNHLAVLSQGHFQTLPTPRRNDELRDLFQSTNSLAEQLQHMRQAIRMSERMSVLGRLSAGLAHQLRNHVTGARMALQLHRRKCDSADTESADVALRQLSLTEDCLKSFLAAGKPTPPRHAWCSLRGIIDELALLFGPMMRHRKVHFERAGADDALVHADADQIRQLLTNLLVNAVDAAGDAGHVTIECQELPGNVVAVRMVDDGPGIPAGLEASIFEPFVSSKPEGVGLGLAVARQIAQAHGGDVTYSRRANRTQFEFTLPRGVPRDETRAPTRQQEPVSNEG